MKDGFIRVAAATPDIHVADPQYNSEQIIELMEQGSARGVKVMVFPELCLTAYTCSDLKAKTWSFLWECPGCIKENCTMWQL